MEFIIWGFSPKGFYEYITTSYNYEEVESIIEEEKKENRYTHYYISGENEYLKQTVRECEISEYF